MIKSALFTATILSGAWLLFAGDPADSKFRVNVEMVQLRVVVTDSVGRYVPYLSAHDFGVFENGVEQNVRIVSPQASPTTVFVLMDTSNHMYESFAYVEDAIASFIRELDPADRLALYSFSRNVTRLAAPTLDRLSAMIALRHAVLGDDTSFCDSILVTLREAAKSPGNKVLVVFSNGPDTSSVLTPAQVRAVAEDEGIPIYIVSTRDQNPLMNAAFADLTQNTGGKLYFATQWQKQRAAFEAIDEELKNSYVIGYYPHDAAPGYRKIDVQIAGDAAHAYRVRTRAGYRASDLEQ